MSLHVVSRRSRRTSRSLALLLVAAVVALIVPFAASAAAPPAGAVIGNQASATYTDPSLVNRTATSNTVVTTVQQVASLTLTASQTRLVAPGGTAYYPHTLTNSGNGTDSFSLSAVAGGFSTAAVYADADGNGVPDSTTAITASGALASGGAFRFVVAARVPGTATGGQTDNVTVTATSVFSGAATQANTDTVNVTGNAVIALTKSLSVASGPSPGAASVTVTLTYTNTGNATATNLTVVDAIGTGATAGMAYVAASGAWSGGTPVTDAVAGDAAGLAYDWNLTAAGKVTAVIASVPPATTGTISFRVTIAAGLAPGNGQTSNTATFAYNDGASVVGPFTTNSAAYGVAQSAAVVSNGTGASSTNGASEPVALDNVVQGSTASFTGYIWNAGNGSDTFDITLGSSTFPAGTTFQLYRADGVTPLSDSNGNGTSDSGPVAAGGSVAIVLKATLPVGATGGPFSVTLTATSGFDGSKSETVVATLTTIVASSADLTYGTARVGSTPPGSANAGNAATTGWGAGPGGSPVAVPSVLPGDTLTLPVFVNNTSGMADSYELLADKDGTFGTINDLPAGWTVTFKQNGSGSCATTGATIANSGVINSGANLLVCAVIGVPAGQPAGAQDLYIRGRSATSGAGDVLWTRTDVGAVRALSIAPSNSGQIYPGGSVVFTHTLTNGGNVVEGNGTGSTVTLSVAASLPGWAGISYYDLNDNGALDAGDPILPSGGIHLTAGAATLADGLAPGETARIFVKAIAPAGAAIGDIATGTLTVTTANGTYVSAIPAVVSAQDTVQVIAGQVRLDKTQSLDASCDGTPDAAYATTPIVAGATPGACIRYRIAATNEGAVSVSGLVVSDSTPPYTTYDDGSRNAAGGACGSGPVDAAAATGTGSVTAPACGATGTVSATIGTLAPGESATVTFGVMINN